jgi:hypothetical protein
MFAGNTFRALDAREFALEGPAILKRVPPHNLRGRNAPVA